MTSLNWHFSGAGTFGGVVSFESEDGKRRNFLRVDFFGGSATADITDEQAKAIVSKNAVGCLVRVEGDVLFSKGQPKPVLKEYQFPTDSGWKEPSGDELLQGIVFDGFCELIDKYGKKLDDGREYYSCSLKVMGGIISRVPVCDSSVHDQLQKGFGVVVGSVFSDISTVYDKGRRDVVFKNEMLVTGFTPRSLRKK